MASESHLWDHQDVEGEEAVAVGVERTTEASYVLPTSFVHSRALHTTSSMLRRPPAVPAIFVRLVRLEQGLWGHRYKTGSIEASVKIQD